MMYNEFLLVEVIEENKVLKVVNNKSWRKVKVLEGKLKGKLLIVNNLGLTDYEKENNRYFLDERRIYMEVPE